MRTLVGGSGGHFAVGASGLWGALSANDLVAREERGSEGKASMEETTGTSEASASVEAVAASLEAVAVAAVKAGFVGGDGCCG